MTEFREAANLLTDILSEHGDSLDEMTREDLEVAKGCLLDLDEHGL